MWKIHKKWNKNDHNNNNNNNSLNYLEESWRPVKTWYHSDSNGRPPVKTGIKKIH